MPGTHTPKQERQAKHVEESYEKKGVSKDEAEHRAWATVNRNGGAKRKTTASKRS